MAALWNRAGHYIFMLWFLSSIYLSFFPRLISAVGDWMSTILRHMVCPSANLECMSETCCARLAENTGCTTVSGYIFATKAHIDSRKKNLLSSNISSTCPHNMVNFGPLAAEIGPVVWGTPAHFNGFRALAALLHGTVVVGVSHTLRR